MDSKTVISTSDLNAERDDRFHRLKLIRWWDQDLLRRAKVLVIGAGALGNEIVKNLALLGIGNVLIADLDTVENSNLSRSILFREADVGRPKAQVAAEFARQIFPGITTHFFHGNVVYDLGLGVYRWADVVIGGLDNREARLAINRACLKLNKPFVDGAIEELNGVARVFYGDGPCYECTMGRRDWDLLRMRRSCALLTRDQMLEGKVPTTPTVSSVIAGIQVQEAVKFLHGQPVLAGRGFQFFGMTAESYVVEYTRKEECYSHDYFEKIIRMAGSVNQVTGRQLIDAMHKQLGAESVIELNTDLLSHLECAKCQTRRPVFRSLGSVTVEMGRCPQCGEACEPVTISTLYGNEEFLDRTLGEIGIPPFEIVTARKDEERLHILFEQDAAQVLGPLWKEGPSHE